MTYYNEILKNVLQPLNEALKTQESHLKNIQTSARNSRQKFIEYTVAKDTAYSKCKNSVMSLDEILEKFSSLVNAKELKTSEREKYDNAINQALKQCKESEVQYKTKITESQAARLAYIKSLGFVLNTYKNEENERLNACQKTFKELVNRERDLNSKKNDKLEHCLELVNKINKNENFLNKI